MLERKSLRSTRGLAKLRLQEKNKRGKNMTYHFLNRLWTIEPRNGVGFDIEFADSRPVWTVRDGEHDVMPFQGTVILLPFITITIGNVWEEIDDE